MTARYAVEIEKLNFSYRGTAAPTLKKVDLQLAEGGFYSIIGPNGGGKTTLLKLILGLLTPDSGTIRILGLPPSEARFQLGYMPQYHQLDPAFPIRVIDVVLMGRLRRGFWGRFSREDRRIAEEALGEMGMGELAGRHFAELSGGQRQRVLIAANVDPGAEGQFYATLNRLRRNLTLLTVSHDLGFVNKDVDEVICVNHSVSVHPVGELTGEVINSIYRCGMHTVIHGEDCRCVREGEAHHG